MRDFFFLKWPFAHFLHVVAIETLPTLVANFLLFSWKQPHCINSKQLHGGISTKTTPTHLLLCTKRGDTPQNKWSLHFVFSFFQRRKKGTCLCNHRLTHQGTGQVSSRIPLVHNRAYHYSCPHFTTLQTPSYHPITSRQHVFQFY